MPAAEMGGHVNPAQASQFSKTPSADPSLGQDTSLPTVTSTSAGLYQSQQAPEATLKEVEHGTTAPSSSLQTQQEAASTLSWPGLAGGSHDDCDALSASHCDDQTLGNTESNAVGLCFCAGTPAGETAGQVSAPKQSNSLQQQGSGPGLFTVCLQLNDSDGVTLVLNPGRRLAFASAFVSAHAFAFATPCDWLVCCLLDPSLPYSPSRLTVPRGPVC